MAAPLTTTSYAILGLLAVRSWTSYELAEQMRRALGRFWPRAESGIYEEPKKLVAHGLATAAQEQVGRRPRTRYTITPAGRKALRAWVPTPGAGPRLEFEQAVKIFFAEHGDRETLLRHLQGVRRDLAEDAAAMPPISRDYLDGRGPFPQRLPWLILVGRLLDEVEQAVDRWAAWAIDEVERWPDDIALAEPAWDVLAEMADHEEALARRVTAAAADSAQAPAGDQPHSLPDSG